LVIICKVNKLEGFYITKTLVSMSESRLPINPFPGIRSYETEEDYLFFGREQQIKELGTLMSTTHFVAITGASGCGKSSLIKAGLIPSLVKKSELHERGKWEYAIFRPGDDPIGQMADALFGIIKNAKEGQSPCKNHEEAETVLRSGQDGILKLIGNLNLFKGRNLLIIIDQFEELFRFKGGFITSYTAAEARHFVDLLLFALDQESVPVYIIVSMRSDFIDECTDFPGLTEKINHGYYLIPRMTGADIRAAITGPVAVCQAQISEKLVNRLLEEIGNETDQLPVLQHALMRTWEKWIQTRASEPVIDEHHYEAIGTIREALSMHAEEVFAELTGPRQQYIAEKLFKALVAVGEESRSTRRPTQLAEICMVANAKPEEVIEVVNCFRRPGRTFIMPPVHVPLNEDSVVDITHESLMRIWVRLHNWMEEETNSAQLYLRLSKSAELYQQGKTVLWVDPELHLAVRWKEHTNPNQAWANRYDPAFDRAISFLNYSKKESELSISLKEERQRRELVRARRFAIILGIASIVSIFFLIISINLTFKAEASEKKSLEKEKLAQTESLKAAEQRKEAIIQRRISEQQQEIAEQQKLITEEQKEFAITQQQIAIAERKEAVLQRQFAETAKSEAEVARDDAREQGRIALEQKQIAETERTKAEISEQNARRLRLLAVANAMAIKSVEMQTGAVDDLPALLALQAHQMNLQNEGSRQDPDIFRALSGAWNSDKLVRIYQNEVRSVAVGNKSGHLYSCSLDGTVKIIDPDHPDQPFRFLNTGNAGQEGFFSLALSADERFAAAGTYDGTILLWDFKGSDPLPRSLKGHTFIITSLCFNPATGELASVSADGTVRLWDPSGGYIESRVLDQSQARITAAAFSPDGSVFSWGNEKGAIKLIHYKSMFATPVNIQSEGSPVYSLAFSISGDILASGDVNGTITLWSREKGYEQLSTLIGHISRISSLQFFPKDQILGSCSFDGSVRLWNFRKPEEPPIVIDDYDFWITSLAVSADGNQLYTGSADKTIRIKTIDMETLAGGICSKVKRNMTREEWNKYVGTDIEYTRTCSNIP
jgi:WD40 repeat protein